MLFCSNKDIDKLIRQLIGKGWRFQRRSKHNRLTPPSGKGHVIVARTPSDRRSYENLRRDIRRVKANAAP
jgi:hypothetical protein